MDSPSPDSSNWHEAPSVTITRLLSQLVLSVGVLTAAVLIAIARPEYTAGAALAIGVVLGSWFGMLHEPRLRR